MRKLGMERPHDLPKVTQAVLVLSLGFNSFWLCFSICRSFIHWVAGHRVFFLVALPLKKLAGNRSEENDLGMVLSEVQSRHCPGWGTALNDIDSRSEKEILFSVCWIVSGRKSPCAPIFFILFLFLPVVWLVFKPLCSLGPGLGWSWAFLYPFK